MVVTSKSLSNCVSDALSLAPQDGAVLLQIGAHLAWLNANDAFGPVIHSNIKAMALLVEPQPHIYQRLAASLGSEARVRVEHAAVCALDASNVTFYSLDPSIDALTGSWRMPTHSGGAMAQLPHWSSQIASLSREHVLRSMPAPLKLCGSRCIVPVVVRCDSVPTLLARQGIKPASVRAMTIDTEGHDAPIILSLDLSRFRGLRVLHFEHKHTNARPLCAVFHRLVDAGFKCSCDEENVSCRRHHRQWGNVSGSRSAACRGVPSGGDDPWASCVQGRLSTLLGLCIDRRRAGGRHRIIRMPPPPPPMPPPPPGEGRLHLTGELTGSARRGSFEHKLGRGRGRSVPCRRSGVVSS
jgi:hypothetical protein